MEIQQEEQAQELYNRVAELEAHVMDVSGHLEGGFSPTYLTLLAEKRWLLTHEIQLALLKCLKSSKYEGILSLALGRAIDFGMQEGLEAGHKHRVAGRSLSVVDAYNLEVASADYVNAVKALEDVHFPLVDLSKSKKDAGMDEVLDCFLLDGPLTELPEAASLQPCIEQLSIPCPHHVRNSRNKSVVSQVKSSDGNSSSSDIAKLTHAVNQQTSDVTTAMTAILKQFQATPPPASVKAVEEICVTCGGPHPYYQCLAADGNTFPEYQDNIQGYVAAATGNYNRGNAGYRPPDVVNQTIPPGFVQQNGQNNQNRFSQPQGYKRGNNFNQNANYQAPIQQSQSVPLSELEKFKKMNDVNMKAIQAQTNNVKNELRNEMQSS
ncbi:hypothetical protein Tco_1127640, partial [Tanacetum coccineum]